ncbi:MAG TPA: hypothetical protein VJ890_23205 [Vineibacter sp.]|nr:hypothetical protein [Vineibacter sp.]
MDATRLAPACRVAAIAIALGALGACGKMGEQNKAAYEVCLKAAKQDARIGKASFASFEGTQVAGGTGEEELRVNIPYELDGKKAVYQCIALKQTDGSFKVVF